MKNAEATPTAAAATATATTTTLQSDMLKLDPETPETIMTGSETELMI